jgi:uncharacterized protein (DUF433 family)
VTDLPRPVITVDPKMRWGAPHIKGVSTGAIVDTFLAGESAEAVAEDYGLTRHEVLLALWFEGSYGTKKMRRLLGWWAHNVAFPVLGGWDKSKTVEQIEVPEVPDRG